MQALTLDDLALATGGTTHHHHHQQAAHHAAAPPASGGFFDSLYKGVVNHFAANIGGTKLADQMYGGHASASDTARAQAAMKQFLVQGNKLPKGVPNLFG